MTVFTPDHPSRPPVEAGPAGQRADLLGQPGQLLPGHHQSRPIRRIRFRPRICKKLDSTD